MGMRKPTGISDKSPASRSSNVETKKRPLAANNSLLSVLRPKVYIIDSSSFKQLVQELTGKTSPNTSSPLPSPSPSSSSLSSSPAPLPLIEDQGSAENLTLSGGNSTSDQILPEMSLDANSMSSPYDMGYVPFPSTHKGFDFSYDDIESWLLDMEPAMTSVSTSHEMEPVDVSVYDYDFS